MITVKINKRANGTISSISTTGHTTGEVNASVSALTQSCGYKIESLKGGKVFIDEKGTFLLSDIRQSKPVCAIAETLAEGLDSIARKNKYNLQVMYFNENA